MLPLLLIAGGLWFWRRPVWPQEHECVVSGWSAERVREVDLQIYDGETLVAREALSFPDGMRPIPWQGRLVLPEGHFESSLFVRWDDGKTSSVRAPLEVRGKEALAWRLPDAPAPR